MELHLEWFEVQPKCHGIRLAKRRNPGAAPCRPHDPPANFCRQPRAVCYFAAVREAIVAFAPPRTPPP
jgi:hypothetical protein